MELLELVREIEGAADEGTSARVARSRATLLAAIVREPRSRARSRSRWIWGGTAAGGLSAATVVIAALIVGTVAPVVARPASAAAVEALDQAAELVITGVDPVLQPGQYLRVRETYELVTLWDADAGGPDGILGFNTATLGTAEGAVHGRGIRDLYLPDDRAGDWVLDDRFVNEVLDVWGDSGTLDAYQAMAAEAPGRDADPDGIQSLPGGFQEGVPDIDEDDQFYDRFRPFYDEMPRDPSALLEWYRAKLSSTDDWILFQSIGRGLSTDLMPADLRAASLRVLGLLDGVDVTGVEGSVTTLAMTSNLGMGSEFGDLLVSELDLDTATGRIVGGRESYPKRPTGLIPAGVPWATWVVDVSVVDSAPTP